MSTKSLILATDELAICFQNEAQTFLDRSGRWNDVNFAAKTAVAEYIANQKGFTLYKTQK